ncbi:MAG: polysaccharide deacetylase family protein, partial [Oscillospiraceae bacterium]|nr:polysaccharide deacetylase family protein [Oscillospiraceae bacterium]
AAVCVRQQADLVREGALDQQVAQLEQELADRQSDFNRLLEEQQAQLKARQAELDQAQDTIDLLSQYSLASPDGEVPEYTTLFPDFYAPAWEGEEVTGGKVCCLTFDDGPSDNTDKVLEILDRYGIKATFFVIGRTGAADQERMRQIVAAGHTIAMHSWSHDYHKVYASVESFLEDFDKLYQWIHEVTGVYPQVFRFPGGSINGYDRGVYQEIIAEMTRRGFVYFDWNASAQDATTRPRSASDIAADCLKGVGKDLVVVLSHDSAARRTTVDALPAVIEGYQGAGYTFSALHPGVTPVTMGYPAIR